MSKRLQMRYASKGVMFKLVLLPYKMTGLMQSAAYWIQTKGAMSQNMRTERCSYVQTAFNATCEMLCPNTPKRAVLSPKNAAHSMRDERCSVQHAANSMQNDPRSSEKHLSSSKGKPCDLAKRTKTWTKLLRWTTAIFANEPQAPAFSCLVCSPRQLLWQSEAMGSL